MTDKPDFSRETYWHTTRPGWAVLGVDEAGRGPWAGPVVAAAAWLTPAAISQLPNGIADSKTLGEEKRTQLYDSLVNQANSGDTLRFASATVAAATIDRHGIIAATTEAMRRACAKLTLPSEVARASRVILLDGKQRLAIADDTPASIIETHIKGDGRILSIAIASIVAKVTRDRLMAAMSRQYPMYGWDKNKGYGTKAHALALARYGVSRHHRKSFRPVADHC